MEYVSHSTVNVILPFLRVTFIFLLLGIIWLINAVDIVLKTEWLFYLFIVVAVITVIYAIISSIVIEKRKK